MNKIIINLNPKKDKVSSEVLQNILAYTPMAALSAVILLFIVVGLQIVSLKKMHTVSRYKKKWAQWEQRYNLIQAIKTEIVSLEREKNDLEKVIAPEYEMETILEDIFASLPKNIWFSDLNFNKGILGVFSSLGHISL